MILSAESLMLVASFGIYKLELTWNLEIEVYLEFGA
jgi:hypothetical protein